MDLPRFDIARLGPAKIDSPVAIHAPEGFVDDDDRMLYGTCESEIAAFGGFDRVPRLEIAGPRRHLFFDPVNTRAGIVTCGGLCPGLNDVIRALTMGLHYVYGVRRIYGFRYGYEGFIPRLGHEVVNLTPDSVDNIHEQGGTILASSRGEQDPAAIVDTLERMDINLFFPVGGDGTLRGALAIAREIERRDLNIAVVGVPKTIDNDIDYLDYSFGFQTAYGTAVSVINGAHTEATGAPRGVGVVKLMGRHSGFIACYATLASTEVNYTLIPESPFELEGPCGLLAHLEKRMDRRGHAVIVVAEGAGQKWLANADPSNANTDASGNTLLRDVGPFLCDRIVTYFKGVGKPVNLKYIDPSYVIRSVPANPFDNVYCGLLARHAVHAAMSGRTSMVIGRLNDQFVHIPISTAIARRKRIDPAGAVWRSVVEMTGQPSLVNATSSPSCATGIKE